MNRGPEEMVLLRHYLEQGLGKAEVAEQLGIRRRTVYYRLAELLGWFEDGRLENAKRSQATSASMRRASWRCPTRRTMST
jgi:transcriptional antiterminator